MDSNFHLSNDLQKTIVSLLREGNSPQIPIATGHRVKVLDFVAKVIVFDVYGTMFISAAGDIGHDSAESSEHAFHKSLRIAKIIDSSNRFKVNGTELIKQEIQRVQQKKSRLGEVYPEIDIVKIWHTVLYKLKLAANLKQVLSAIVVYECLTNPVWPMPALMEILESLRMHNVLTGILSNAQFYTLYTFQALTGTAVKDLGFDPSLCFWSYLEGRGKPSNVLFDALNERIKSKGISSKDILYVGNDMLKDIMPAKKVGWKTVLFAGDKRSLRLRKKDERVAGIKADYVIDDLRQLLPS